MTEKKQSIGQRIFNLVRDVQNLNEEQVHEFMSKDMKYKTGSGKAIIYRMICAKYIRRDKNGILHAHIDEYKPLPPYKVKRKKVAKAKVSGLAAAAKAKQDQDSMLANAVMAAAIKTKQDHMNRERQALNYRQAAINAVGLADVLVPRPVAEQPAKKEFLRELGRRIGSYVRP